jgi:hypothetical protein
MNKIKPEYVTPKQAVWLKEKGFKEVVNKYYHVGAISNGVQEKWCNNQDINSDFPDNPYWSAPEQWAVLEWLRLNYRVDIQHTWLAGEGQPVTAYSYHISYPNKKFVKGKSDYWDEFELYLDWGGTGIYKHNSPQEAYSAAFDLIRLNNLI